MKLALLSWLALMAAVYAAVPEAPNFTGVTGMPNQGALVTNVTWIYTNVAVVTPTIRFPQVTVYNGTNGLTVCSVLSWVKNPSPEVTKYTVYYGDVMLSTTNKVTTLSNITSVVFFNVFNTNSTYWSYVTAGNSTNESLPSKVILFQGK